MTVARQLLVVLVAAGALWLACSQPVSHVFIAGQYEPNQKCITPGYAIDVLSGPPPDYDASCDATCVVPPFDSGVYATGMCPPFPPGDDVSGKNPLCALATAALNRHDLCLDSGPSNPFPDASPDAGTKAADSAPE